MVRYPNISSWACERRNEINLIDMHFSSDGGSSWQVSLILFARRALSKMSSRSQLLVNVAVKRGRKLRNFISVAFFVSEIPMVMMVPHNDPWNWKYHPLCYSSILLGKHQISAMVLLAFNIFLQSF